MNSVIDSFHYSGRNSSSDGIAQDMSSNSKPNRSSAPTLVEARSYPVGLTNLLSAIDLALVRKGDFDTRWHKQTRNNRCRTEQATAAEVQEFSNLVDKVLLAAADCPQPLPADLQEKVQALEGFAAKLAELAAAAEVANSSGSRRGGPGAQHGGSCSNNMHSSSSCSSSEGSVVRKLAAVFEGAA